MLTLKYKKYLATYSIQILALRCLKVKPTMGSLEGKKTVIDFEISQKNK